MKKKTRLTLHECCFSNYTAHIYFLATLYIYFSIPGGPRGRGVVAPDLQSPQPARHTHGDQGQGQLDGQGHTHGDQGQGQLAGQGHAKVDITLRSQA